MNWKKLINALIKQESKGDFSVVGDHGLAVGILQTHPNVVTDVNNVYGLNFTLEDRLDPIKSRIICVLYVTWYARYERLGRPPTSKDYALCWHYGPSFIRKEDEDHYWDDVSIYIN